LCSNCGIGDIVAYDLDRERLSTFRIPNLWRERSPKARILSVVTLALHPRDIGSLLIGYTEGAVIFSFKQNKPTKFFQYELPRGAPGGDSDPTSVNSVRYPRLTQALWHPTGTFILTGHEDSSMVVWDPKDGRVIMARTLQDSNVNMPGANVGNYGATPGTFSLKEPLFRIAWCAKQNPEDTGLLIAGGAPTTLLTKGLTFLEFGLTPNYATSSWQILSDHFASPKRQRIFPTPPSAEVIDFCLIPRSSPYYAGAHDPVAVLGLLSSGEIVTLSFPSGQPISPTNNLHISLSLVHPFAHHIDLAAIKRERWLGMSEKRDQFTQLVVGGAEATYPLKRHQNRDIVQTAHADGTIRLWDAGHGDEIENEDVLQVDISQALRRLDNVEVTHMSMSGATGELAAGLGSGETVVFRWGRNPNFGRDVGNLQLNAGGRAEGLMDIRDRADPALKEGLLPLTVLAGKNGAVSAIKLSDVGFLAVGYEAGSVDILDLRVRKRPRS
jgi:syntaxin-binding protein 5